MSDEPPVPEPPAEPPAEPTAEPPAEPPPEPAPEPAPEPPLEPAPAPARATGGEPAPRGSLLRVLLLGVGLLAAAVVFGPWLLTHSLLTRSLDRSLRAVGAGDSALGHAALSWGDGLTLEQLHLDEPQPGAPAALIRLLRVETDLLSGGSGYLFGTPVSSKLVLRDARIDYVVPAAQLAAEPPPAGESPRGFELLPCPLRPALDVQGLDLSCTWTPATASPRRLVVRGMRAEGGGQIERDLAMDLDQGFSCQVDGLRVERLAGPDGPAATLLAVEGARFTTRRLVLPPLALFSTNRVQTEMEVEVPLLRAANLRLTDVKSTLVFQDGQARTTLAATAPQGRLTLASTLDLRQPQRWPATLQLGLHDMQLTGDVAHAAPLLVPLLRANSWSGGRGLPPITLDLDGRLDLCFDPAGALDWRQSVDTLTGKGSCRLGPGELSSSLLIDGYLRALTGLGVSSLLRGVIPQGWPTTGVEARFELPGQGRVRLPQLLIRSSKVTLEVSGETRFSGQFQLTVKTAGEGKEGLLGVLEAIDDVGGVRLEGDLVAGHVQPVLPDLPALLEAARKRGVLELLRKELSPGALKQALEQLKELPGELGPR